jgi:hypothetical protein
MKQERLWIVTGLCLVLTACAAPLEIVEVKKEVKLKVQPGPELVIDEPPTSNCDRGNSEQRKGCIVANTGDQVVVDFRLLQHGQYRLSRFEVCPDADKRSDTNQPCSLSILKRTEFVLFFADTVAIPDEEGIVNFLGLAPDDEVHEFTLVDKNTIEAEYFYRIQACPDDDAPGRSQSMTSRDESGCFWTDPPIINKGVGTFSF